MVYDVVDGWNTGWVSWCMMAGTQNTGVLTMVQVWWLLDDLPVSQCIGCPIHCLTTTPIYPNPSIPHCPSCCCPNQFSLPYSYSLSPSLSSLCSSVSFQYLSAHYSPFTVLVVLLFTNCLSPLPSLTVIPSSSLTVICYLLSLMYGIRQLWFTSCKIYYMMLV